MKNLDNLKEFSLQVAETKKMISACGGAGLPCSDGIDYLGSVSVGYTDYINPNSWLCDDSFLIADDGGDSGCE